MGHELPELREGSGPSESDAQNGTASGGFDSHYDGQDEAGVGYEWSRSHGLGRDRGVEGLTKLGSPSTVEISHEASLRVEQIQRQIALLQDEMRRILPAETEDA